MKLLKLGTVSLDGTKIHANASRHSALSHGHDREERSPSESPGARAACPGRTGGSVERTGWGQSAGRDQAPRAKAQGNGSGQGEDRSAGEKANIEPLIAVTREARQGDWRERFTEPEAIAEDATPVERMKHRLKTKAGRAAYALRKQTVEPVFGIIKSVLGFRQFSLRGLESVAGEWQLVCRAWNLKRIASLRLGA
nr:transposase [Stutzerimonas kirkiae]